MKIYVESIFLLDFKNNKLDFENEQFILKFDAENPIKCIKTFIISNITLNNKDLFLLYKKRSYGYEIYIIYPDYVKIDKFDGIELIEVYFEEILPKDLKEIFKIKYENYKGEYLFHQHIFNYNKEFNINEFLLTSFKLDKKDWSEYIFNEDVNGFKAIELLAIDNFILHRHVMYEFFSREYLERISNDINLYNKLLLLPFFIKIRENVDFLNKSRLLLSQHKLLMENFKVTVNSFIKDNKLFEIHKVIRKKEIFEGIKDDFNEYVNISQQNLNNILIAYLTLVSIVISLIK